jgi:di/tricarboxylate transporter
LQAGDTLLVQGTWENLKALGETHLLLLNTPIDVERLEPEKAWKAIACFGVAITLVLTTHLRLSVCLLAGALGMILTKVLTVDEAYKSVDWRTIFLLAGLIPLGIATEKSGTASYIAHHVLGMMGHVPQLVLLIVIGILSTLFTLVISNVGATVLLVPLVINMAMLAGTDPRLAALVVGIATSNSFMLPTHQVNALYMGPGGYRSVDFIRAGGIMSIVFMVVMIVMVWAFY